MYLCALSLCFSLYRVKLIALSPYWSSKKQLFLATNHFLRLATTLMIMISIIWRSGRVPSNQNGRFLGQLLLPSKFFQQTSKADTHRHYCTAYLLIFSSTHHHNIQVNLPYPGKLGLQDEFPSGLWVFCFCLFPGKEDSSWDSSKGSDQCLHV